MAAERQNRYSQTKEEKKKLDERYARNRRIAAGAANVFGSFLDRNRQPERPPWQTVLPPPPQIGGFSFAPPPQQYGFGQFRAGAMPQVPSFLRHKYANGTGFGPGGAMIGQMPAPQYQPWQAPAINFPPPVQQQQRPKYNRARGLGLGVLEGLRNAWLAKPKDGDKPYGIRKATRKGLGSILKGGIGGFLNRDFNW